MIVLMCLYVIVLIVFVVVYVTRIRPKYNLEMKNIVPDDIIGDPKKLPTEMFGIIGSRVFKSQPGIEMLSFYLQTEDTEFFYFVYTSVQKTQYL